MKRLQRIKRRDYEHFVSRASYGSRGKIKNPAQVQRNIQL
jgi:hypothetical protein